MSATPEVRHFAPYGSTDAACDETVPRSVAGNMVDGDYADGRFTTRRARTTCLECRSSAGIVAAEVSPLVSPRTTPADETAEHEVVVEAEEGSLTSTRFICNAPADAMCHAVWSCDCEGWYEDGVRNGIPAHQPDGDDPDAWHAGRFDPTFCNLREWFDESDEALDGGEVRIPVVATWHGDYYTFALAASPADADTAEQIARVRAHCTPQRDEIRERFRATGGAPARDLGYADACDDVLAILAASSPVAATSEGT